MSSLDSERGNFKLFGLIYWLYLLKFELFAARLLKKRDNYLYYVFFGGVHYYNYSIMGPKTLLYEGLGGLGL